MSRAPAAARVAALAAVVAVLAACDAMPARTGDDGTRLSTSISCRTGFTTCVPVMMPPAMPEAAALRVLAITPTRGAEALATQVESQLSKVRWDDQLFYTLVPGTDPRRQGVIEISGGTPQQADSRFTSSRCKPGLKSCKKPEEQQQVSCTKRTVSMASTVRLQVVQTSAVATRQVSAARDASLCEGDAGALPSAAEMQGVLVAELANKVQDAFAVRSEERPIRLKDDTGQIADADRKARFTQAVAFLKAKRLDRACSVFAELSEVERRSVAVLYNAGFCAEARGDWAAANTLYRTADALTTRPDSDLMDAIKATTLSASQAKIQ